MIFLADANLLIASALTNHVHHNAARKWFDSGPQFATTPITELALVRVASHKNYGLSFQEALSVLGAIQQLPNRTFWPANLELNGSLFIGDISSGMTTDAYLLAVARKNGGKLATFDQGIKSIARGLEAHLQLLEV